MNRSLRIGIALVAAATVLGTFALRYGDAPELGDGEEPERSGASEPSPMADAEVPPGRVASPAAPERPSRTDLLAAGTAYEAEFGLGARVRAFGETSASMTASEREREAEGMLAEITAGEAAGWLVAGQGDFLRLAVAKARHPGDPAALAAAAAEIEAASAARGARTAPVDHGPAFAAYKAREAEIIAEVQGRTSFPGGMSRSDYLRERLEEARIEAYGE